MIGAFLANSSYTLYWVGGTNPVKRNDWRWLDGSPWNFVAWAKNEPNGGIGSGIFGGKDTWTDEPTDSKVGKTFKVATICQRGTSTILPIGPPYSIQCALK